MKPIMHLIVKDKYDQKHAITFHWHGGDLKPQSSWNLSDSLVLDYQKGLPQVTPAAHDVVDLGRLGKLALHDGKVHYFNETTGLWAASDEKADKLQCGLDGQPWLMKDGELKRLKVNLSSNKVDHGSNVFALPQVTKSVSADLATAGLDKAEKAPGVHGDRQPPLPGGERKRRYRLPPDRYHHSPQSACHPDAQPGGFAGANREAGTRQRGERRGGKSQRSRPRGRQAALAVE